MFEVYDSVASTMDVARERVAAGLVRLSADGLPDCAGVLARTQTSGRGQRGKVWRDVPGESLCVTFCLRLPEMRAERRGELAFVAGAAAAAALDAFIAETAQTVRPRIGLKWPNDILLNEKKAGGVLIETMNAPDGVSVALIGLGLNLLTQDFPPDIADSATSLGREGIAERTALAWAEAIYAEIQKTAARLDSEGFAAVLAQWQTYDATPGIRYETEIDGEWKRGVAAGVAPSGALLLRLETGETVAVSSASHLQSYS